MKKLRLVAFDLDGTLIDSHKDIAQAVNHTLMQSGKSSLPEEVITSFVGDGAKKLLERAFGLSPNAPELVHLEAVFQEYYTAHATVFTTLYPAVRETLAVLGTRYLLALCTNKPRATTDQVLLELDLAHYFVSVVAGDDLPQRKPHPAQLLHIARQQSLDPTDFAMIGDGPQDIVAGRAVGAFCVGVAFGMKPPDAMLAAGPHHVVTQFAELQRLLLA